MNATGHSLILYGGAPLIKRSLPPLRRAAPLGLLWLAVSTPLLLYAAVFQSSVSTLFGLVGELLLACLVALLPVKPQALRWFFGGGLVLLLAGGVLERDLSKYDWQVSDKAGLWSALGRKAEVSGYGYRSWNAAGATGPVKLSAEVRLVSGQPAWDWFRSDAKFVLTSQTGKDYPYTHVEVPAAQAEGPPYLMRTFDFRKPLGGTIFRVLVDLRRAEGNAAASVTKVSDLETSDTSSTDGQADTSIVRGAPIGGRQCSGLLLQAWAYRGGGRCLPLTLSNTWTRYSLSWHVPEAVDASVVRVLLSGLTGNYDVRRVRLFTLKRELKPLLPQGGALNLTWGERPEAQSGQSFIPTSRWQQLEVKVRRQARDTTNNTANNTVTAHLSSASGLVLATRNVTLTDATGKRLPEAVSSTRQTIIFGDPNLAGHTLATLGLALMALLSVASPNTQSSSTRSPSARLLSIRSPLLLGVLVALTLFGLVLTGSRAALIGLSGGLVWLVWLRLPQGARRLGFAALGLAGLGLLGVLWPKLSALRLFSLGEVTARSDIWREAGAAFVMHPLRGLGAGGFPRYWAETHGGEAVQHAHNVWLEFASSYGVLGLLSITVLTVGLGYLAWRAGGAKALALVVGVLLMNVFDTTLFYAGVLFPLLLTLGVWTSHRASQRLPAAPQPVFGPAQPAAPHAVTAAKAPIHHVASAGEHNRGVNARQVPPE